MAGARELFPQLAKIVDLAVEHDRVASIGGTHRLLPRNQIDHREPGMAQNCLAEIQHGAVVGPARAQRIERRPGAITPRRVYQAEDSAHELAGRGAVREPLPVLAEFESILSHFAPSSTVARRPALHRRPPRYRRRTG